MENIIFEAFIREGTILMTGVSHLAKEVNVYADSEEELIIKLYNAGYIFTQYYDREKQKITIALVDVTDKHRKVAAVADINYKIENLVLKTTIKLYSDEMVKLFNELSRNHKEWAEEIDGLIEVFKKEVEKVENV